jgi:ABC-type multidrug transport system fused ATPase/permease subunit
MTFQAVDCIYVLDQGQLIHAGSHEELVEQKAEAYMELVGSSWNT